jgi:glycosyltransferase involved in cell wall biosynthesis
MNFGARLAKGSWVAYLDDDNQYETNHISHLVDLVASTNARAAYSGRRLYRKDGSPYLLPRFPWAQSDEAQKRIYQIMIDRGVFRVFDNVCLDVHESEYIQGPIVNSTVMAENDPVMMVDTSCWLVQRDTIIRHTVPESYTASEIADNTAPDDKLLETLLRRGVTIARSGEPTVKYFLGGMSN